MTFLPVSPSAPFLRLALGVLCSGLLVPGTGCDGDAAGPAASADGSSSGGAASASPLSGLPTPDEVVSVTYGPGAGHGQEGMPAVVLDTPGGGSATEAAIEVVALGNGGRIVLAFRSVTVIDEPGPDLRVVENVFVPAGRDARDPYAEVAVVSVSEDGETWFTFPFDYVPEGAHVVDRFVGFAGLSPGGDDFDLADLGLERARYVRLQDAGTGTSGPLRDADGDFLDDPGNACCPGESEGFDLDGVVALHWR